MGFSTANYNDNHQPQTFQKGSVVIETAIVLNLWVLLFIGAAEVAFLGEAYMALNAAAREGVRVGISMKDYPEGVESDLHEEENGATHYMECINIDFKADVPAYPYANCPALITHYKIAQVLATNQAGSKLEELSQARISTARVNDEIRVTITMPARTILSVIPGLTGITMTTSDRGVFIYP
jgi:hypothetical protein